MPITYDIETDYLYQKGIAKGVEKGIEVGEQKLKSVIREMAKNPALSLEQIARYTLTSVSYVQEVLRGDSQESD